MKVKAVAAVIMPAVKRIIASMPWASMRKKPMKPPRVEMAPCRAMSGSRARSRIDRGIAGRPGGGRRSRGDRRAGQRARYDMPDGKIVPEGKDAGRQRRRAREEREAGDGAAGAPSDKRRLELGSYIPGCRPREGGDPEMHLLP